MLILTRFTGEAIRIGDDITIAITNVTEADDKSSASVRIGIDAPRDIDVDRSEIYEQKKQKRRLSNAEDKW